MSRRGRAIAFGVLALVAAALAASLADGYGSSVARGYGPLRPVVVAAADLPAGKAIEPRLASTRLELRRVPERFVPAGTLASPREAVGLVPAAELPAGSYLLASQLHPVERPGGGLPGLGRARHPVEISVSGADALLATGSRTAGARVDVVVTVEPGGPGTGRTYVAAEDVPLLALGPGDDGPGGLSAATLGLSRPQALRLISAESFARQVTLLPLG